MSSVFVTVGMGPWPFDRLVRAVVPLCVQHDVFVQTGTSSVVPPCPHQRFLEPAETLRRIRDADVVVTHGGNTVRQVQRAGKVPIVVAREAARGEMRNDHQVAYLAGERAGHRVRVLAGDEPALAAAVADHPAVEDRLLAAAPPLPPPADPDRLAEVLDAALLPVGGPFDRHPLARYRWAWAQLAARTGRHLDLGIGDGAFTTALHRDTKLGVVGVDAHPDYLRALRAAEADLALARVGHRIAVRDREVRFGQRAGRARARRATRPAHSPNCTACSAPADCSCSRSPAGTPSRRSTLTTPS